MPQVTTRPGLRVQTTIQAINMPHGCGARFADGADTIVRVRVLEFQPERTPKNRGIGWGASLVFGITLLGLLVWGCL